MLDRLTSMAVFVRAAEAGSFAAVAESLEHDTADGGQAHRSVGTAAGHAPDPAHYAAPEPD